MARALALAEFGGEPAPRCAEWPSHLISHKEVEDKVGVKEQVDHPFHPEPAALRRQVEALDLAGGMQVTRRGACARTRVAMCADDGGRNVAGSDQLHLLKAPTHHADGCHPDDVHRYDQLDLHPPEAVEGRGTSDAECQTSWIGRLLTLPPSVAAVGTTAAAAEVADVTLSVTAAALCMCIGSMRRRRRWRAHGMRAKAPRATHALQACAGHASLLTRCGLGHPAALCTARCAAAAAAAAAARPPCLPYPTRAHVCVCAQVEGDGGRP